MKINTNTPTCKLLFLFLFLSNITNAQINLDSLQTIIKSVTVSDSVRIIALDKITKAYNYSKPDSALWYGEQEYNLAKKLGWKREMARVLSRIGTAHYVKGNTVIALGKFEQCLELRLTLNDPYLVAMTYNNIASTYSELGYYKKSLKHFELALALQDSIKRPQVKLSVLQNIALIYMGIEEFDIALKYLNETIEIAQKVEDYDLTSSLANIAIIHQQRNEHIKAMDYFISSLDQPQSQNTPYLVAVIYNYMAQSHIALDNHDEAEKCFRKSLAIHEATGSMRELAETLVRIGEYIEISEPDSALKLGNRALSIGVKTQELDVKASSLELLYRLYKGQDDFSTAFRIHEQYVQVMDSIELFKAEKEMIKKAYQHEYEQRSQEDLTRYEQLLNNEKMAVIKERYLTIGGVIILFLALIAIVRSKFSAFRNERTVLINQIKTLKEDSIMANIALGNDNQDILLEREKLNAALEKKLNDSDWNILSALYNDPLISNKKLADQVYLSLEGASSSLRKMYFLFNVRNDRNKKLSLIKEAIRLSGDMPSVSSN